MLWFDRSVDSFRRSVFEAPWIVPRYPRILHLLCTYRRITPGQTILTPAPQVFVEDTPETQQVPGSGEYDDLVATVQLFKTNPNQIPPLPPPDTNPGYNEVLDLPRPSTIDNYLKFYDTVFLIDDSGSMANDNKWTELNNALIGISGTAIDYDADGIDLYFLNSNDKFKFRDEIHGVDDKPKVAAAMAKVGPSGGTPTGLRCRERIREYLDRLNAAVGTPRYSEIKPLDLICITDGVPSTSPLSLSSLLTLRNMFFSRRRRQRARQGAHGALRRVPHEEAPPELDGHPVRADRQRRRGQGGAREAHRAQHWRTSYLIPFFCVW